MSPELWYQLISDYLRVHTIYEYGNTMFLSCLHLKKHFKGRLNSQNLLKQLLTDWNYLFTY